MHCRKQDANHEWVGLSSYFDPGLLAPDRLHLVPDPSLRLHGLGTNHKVHGSTIYQLTQRQ